MAETRLVATFIGNQTYSGDPGTMILDVYSSALTKVELVDGTDIKSRLRYKTWTKNGETVAGYFYTFQITSCVT